MLLFSQTSQYRSTQIMTILGGWTARPEEVRTVKINVNVAIKVKDDSFKRAVTMVD